MQQRLLYLSLILAIFYSCSSSKKVVDKNYTNNNSIADKIIWTAISYKGTPYKYGGTSSSGMDCSGLVFTSFKTRGKNLPRVSYMMAKEGRKISLSQVKKGDLLFFKTLNRSRINHVGLVTSVGETIQFIHSTNSKGVIVSSLDNPYWKKAYTKARRVLE